MGQDHPRSCGEQWVSEWEEHPARGSPPLMRGTVGAPLLYLANHRITPAHAGNSLDYPTAGRGPEDHPRSCGEQPVSTIAALILPGSPPLMRGTVAEQLSSIDPLRITPAHAGNSGVCQGCLRIPRDHPRSCGEQNLTPLSGGHVSGSPPLMRGTAPAHQRKAL